MINTDIALQKKLKFLDDLDLFRKSDTYAFYNLTREYRTLLKIVLSNYHELHKIIELHNEKLVSRDYWERNYRYRSRVQIRIIRCVSNYLTSLFSMVDFSRNHISKKLASNHFVNEYLENSFRILLSSTPHHRFLQDLRNYVSHYTYVKVGSDIKYNVDWEKPRTSIFLSKEVLLQWKGWNSSSKKFIDQEEKKIILNDLHFNHKNSFFEYQKIQFLMLLIIDQKKTKTFFYEMEEMYNSAVNTGMTHKLVFDSIHIRALRLAYNKANQKIMFLGS